MPKYVIEREMPGAGRMSTSDLQSGVQRSNAVLRELGPGVQWLQSYVTDDKIYCVYIADDEGLVRRHAEMSGFPAHAVARVVSTIDPASAG